MAEYVYKLWGQYYLQSIVPSILEVIIFVLILKGSKHPILQNFSLNSSCFFETSVKIEKAHLKIDEHPL